MWTCQTWHWERQRTVQGKSSPGQVNKERPESLHPFDPTAEVLHALGSSGRKVLEGEPVARDRRGPGGRSAHRPKRDWISAQTKDSTTNQVRPSCSACWSFCVIFISPSLPSGRLDCWGRARRFVERVSRRSTSSSTHGRRSTCKRFASVSTHPDT